MKRARTPFLVRSALGVALTAAFAAVAAFAATPLRAATWQADPAHSSVGFSVKHLMVSTVRGTFGTFTATVEGDPSDPATARIDATIQVGSVDTREPKRDAHLKSADFFDAADYPTMTFVSRKVEKTGDGRARVTGDLTIRGVTKPVTLDVEYTAPVKDAWGGTRVGATATATIDRQDFGVKWNKSLDAGGVMVSDQVKIQLDLELVEKKAAPK